MEAENEIVAKMLLAYIEGNGITKEEYVKEQREMFDKLSKRYALWKHIEPTKKYKSIDEYRYYLVRKANIKIRVLA